MDWACVSTLATLFFKALTSRVVSFSPTLSGVFTQNDLTVAALVGRGGALSVLLVVSETHIELEHR